MIIMEAGFGLRPYSSNKVESLERDQRKKQKWWIKSQKMEYSRENKVEVAEKYRSLCIFEGLAEEKC